MTTGRINQVTVVKVAFLLSIPPPLQKKEEEGGKEGKNNSTSMIVTLGMIFSPILRWKHQKTAFQSCQQQPSAVAFL